MIKKIVTGIILLCCIFLLPNEVKAQTMTQDTTQEIYNEQLQSSGADNLLDSLPSDAQKKMDFIGVKSIQWKDLANISIGKIFTIALQEIKTKIPDATKSCAYIIGVIVLTAMSSSMRGPFATKSLSEVIDIIGSLCICTSALYPIMNFISETSSVIRTASNFLLCYVPVMSGIMFATGKSVSATSYNLIMMSTCEIISQISAHIFIPLICMMTTIAVVSSISPRLNLSGVYNLFHSSLKWVLGFVMSIFTGILSVQNILNNNVDTCSNKALKFIVSSFVPVIGGSLSDALDSIKGCVKVLMSGVGIFGVVGVGFIFLPIICKALVWIFILNIGACVGRVFNMQKNAELLYNVSKVISLLLSIVLSCVFIIIISTVIILVTGGHT